MFNKKRKAVFVLLIFITALFTLSWAAYAETPTFSDSLDGSSVGNDNRGVVFGPGYSNNGATLSADDSFIRYPGSNLPSSQGTIEFFWKPPANIYELYSTRHSSWTNYYIYPPPSSGFLLDNIGWRAAPPGSFSISLMPQYYVNPEYPLSSISWGMWSGYSWYYGTNTHSNRPTLSAAATGSQVALSWSAEYPIWLWDQNIWYKITATWGPNGNILYVNGKQWARSNYTGAICTSKSFSLGQDEGYWPYGPHSMFGTYDELKIYNSQLVPAPENADVSHPSGYVLYYGTQPKTYTNTVELGQVTNHNISLSPGTYYFAIAAKTSTGFIGPRSSEVCVTVTQTTPNNPPWAEAGPDQTIQATSPNGAEVVLSGSGSADPDGDELTYTWNWSGGSGSGVTLNRTFPVGATLVTLTVSDGKGGEATDTVLVTVTPMQDTVPPVSQVYLEPQAPNGNGWYNTNVQFRIEASDTGSGVAKIEYQLNSGAWSQYNAPVTLSDEGVTPIAYRAVDNSGNIEPENSVIIKIDKTAPEITVFSPGITAYTRADAITIDFTASDLGSGLATCDATLDGSSVSKGASIDGFDLGFGIHSLVITATDFAGNTFQVKSDFSIGASMDSLFALLKKFHEKGWVEKGAYNSLYAKLRAAKSALERGDNSVAANILKAFNNELEAQSGKHVTEYAAKVLIEEAQYVASCL